MKTSNISDLVNVMAENEFISGHKNILVIDDDKIFLKTISRYADLLSKNINVYEFEMPQDAVRFYLDNPVDLVIIDINLGSYFGPHIGDVIRTIGFKEVPIIYVSATKEYVRDFYHWGSANSSFLSKPVAKNQFQRLISHYLV